jgi:hypothetical protein
MANYAKRDARAEWSRSLGPKMAEQIRQEEAARDLRCHCGEKATLAFTKASGESWYFCPEHQSEAQEMMDRACRCR